MADILIVIRGTDETKEAFSSVNSGLESVRDKGSGVTDSLISSFSSFDLLITKIATTSVETLSKSLDSLGHFAIDSTKNLVEGGIASNAEFETLQNKFTVLLGSYGEAAQRAKELQQVGLTSPAQLNDISQMDTKLTNFGLDTQDTAAKVGVSGASIRQTVIDTSAAVANGAGDMGGKMNRIALDIGKFYQTGTAASITDLMRLGATTKEELEKAGMSFDAHGHAVGEHSTNVGILLKALGDKYHGMSDVAMTSLAGIQSNWADMTQFIERTLTGTMFDALKNSYLGLNKELTSTSAIDSFNRINEAIGRVLDVGGQLFGYFDANHDLIPNILSKIADGFQWVAGAVVNVVTAWRAIETNFFQPIMNIASAALGWGEGIVGNFINGILAGLGPLAGALQSIGDVITYWLRPNSPPKIVPTLDTFGTDAMNVYLQGYTKADFGVFNQLGTQISEAINGLVNSNALSKEGAIPAILGTREAVAAAIAQVEQTGSATQEAFDRIAKAAGAAGSQIVELTKSQIDLIKANKDVADSTAAIAALNDQYNQQLVPLNDRLKGIADRQRAIKDETRAATEGDRSHLQALSDQYEAFQKLAATNLQPLKSQLDTVREALTALTAQTAQNEEPFKAQLQGLQDQYEAYQKLAATNLQPLKDQLDGAKAAQQALNDQTAASLQPLNAQITALQNQYSAYQQLAQANLQPLRSELDSVKAAQQDLSDTLASQVDPLRGQLDYINGQMQQISNAQKLQDLNDRINGTGKHANDLAHAQLAVALDINHQKEAEIRYSESVDKLHEEIAAKKLAGKDSTDLEVKLQELQLRHQDDLLRSQEKLAEDKTRLANVGPKGSDIHHAQLEKEKIGLEEQIKTKTDAAKIEQDHLRERAHSLEEQIKTQEGYDKAHLAAIKEQEAATREHIRAIQEAAAAESLSIKEKEQGLVAQIKTQEAADKAKLAGIKEQEDGVKNQLKAIESAAKTQENALKAQAKGYEDQIKDQETANKAKLDGIKAEQDATKDIIKAKEDSHKAELAALTVESDNIKKTQDDLKAAHEKNLAVLDQQLDSAKNQLKTAQDHLSTLQDHNKVMSDNAKLMEQQDKLLEGMAKKAAVAAKAGAKVHHPKIHLGKIGAGGGGISLPDLSGMMPKRKDETDAGTKDHGDTKEYKDHLDAEAGKVAAINGAIKSAKDSLTGFATTIINAFNGGGVLGVLDLALDKFMALGSGVVNALATSTGPILNMLEGWGNSLWGWVAPMIPRAISALSSLTTEIGQWATGTALPWITDQVDHWSGVFFGWASGLWNVVSPAIAGYWEGLKSWFFENEPKVVAQLGTWAGQFGAWAGDLWTKYVQPKIMEFWNGLTSWVSDLGEQIKGKLGELAGQFTAWASDLPDKIMTFLKNWPDQFGKLLDSLGTTVAPYLGKLADTIGNFLGDHGVDILKAIGGGILAIGVFIGESAWVIAQHLATWGSALIDWIGPRIPGVLDAIGKLLTQLGGWIMGTALPWLGEQLGILGPKLWQWIKDEMPTVLKILGDVFNGIANALDPGGAIVQSIVGVLALGAKILWQWIEEVTPKVLATLGSWKDQLVAWFNDTAFPWLKSHFAEWAAAAWQWIQDTTPVVLAKLGSWKDQLVTWFTETALPWLKTHLGEWKDAAWQWIKDATPLVIDKLGEWKDDILKFFGEKKDAFIAKLGEWKDAALAWVDQAKDKIESKFDDFKKVITDWITSKVSEFTTAFSALKDVALAWVTDAANGVEKKLDGFKSTISEWLSNPTGVIKTLTNDAKGLGSAIVDGIISGLNHAWTGVTGALSSLASGLPQPVRDALGIKSPSTVFADLVGAPISEGIAHGITSNDTFVTKALDGMALKITDFSRFTMPSTTSPVGAASINLTPSGVGLMPSSQDGARAALSPTNQTNNSGHTFTFQNCVFNGTTSGAVQQVFEASVTERIFGKV